MGADGEEEPEHEFAIETARLMLRRLVPADRQAVATLSANAAVAENLCSALSPDGRGGFVVAERAQGAVVGFAGLRPHPRHARLGRGLPVDRRAVVGPRLRHRSRPGACRSRLRRPKG